MKTITINVPDGCEVQIVRKEEKKESIIRTYQDLIDTNTIIKGYYIGAVSGVIRITHGMSADYSTRNITASEKVAKSMLAMAIISQLIPYYGGEVADEEWNNTCPKHVIRKQYDKIYTDSTMYYYHFLAFHTSEQRDEFLKWNLDLVKDYLMIND